ncbi:MAG: XdhC family protein [Euryarchaeota archaeon]|nr:XdhC family protein [Euryarchaeota archaeon]
MRGLLREMLHLTERRRPFAVCTVVETEGSVPGKLGSTMVVTEDGTARGTVGGAGLEDKVKAAALEALRSGQGGVRHFDLAKWKPGGLNSICGGSVDVSVLVHRPLPHLLLFGGGHCGKALSDIAPTLDWDVTLVDARAEYANRERFPNAVAAVAAPPAAWAKEADLSDYSHAYLLGHSWELDVEILAALLPRFPGFVGAIGSAAKRHHIESELRKRGIPDRHIDRIVCPIGAPVGAESPEEIAVAVAAEIVGTLKRPTERLPEATAR